MNIATAEFLEYLNWQILERLGDKISSPEQVGEALKVFASSFREDREKFAKPRNNAALPNVVFDNLDGADALQSIDIKFDNSGKEFACKVSSCCGKSGFEESVTVMAALTAAYAYILCSTPKCKAIGFTPNDFIVLFDKFLFDTIEAFEDKAIKDAAKNIV